MVGAYVNIFLLYISILGPGWILSLLVSSVTGYFVDGITGELPSGMVNKITIFKCLNKGLLNL